MEYVLDFVNMQRFQDPLLVHIVIFTQVVLNLENFGKFLKILHFSGRFGPRGGRKRILREK